MTSRAERGSGARYIDGKPKMEYVPMNVVLRMIRPDLPELEKQVAYLVTLFEEQNGDPELLTTALSLIGFKDTCDVFEYGARKYAAWNWATGMKWSVPLACIKRHLLAIAGGEAVDPESGLPHMGHVGCNIVMLLHFIEHYPQGDDLPGRECVYARNDYREPDRDEKALDLGKLYDREENRAWEEYRESQTTGYKPMTSEDFARLRKELEEIAS